MPQGNSAVRPTNGLYLYTLARCNVLMCKKNHVLYTVTNVLDELKSGIYCYSSVQQGAQKMMNPVKEKCGNTKSLG